MNASLLPIPASLLLVGLMTISCAQSESPAPTKKLLEALPETIARVNADVVTRQQVVDRFQQAQSMMAHQQHSSQGTQSAKATQDSNGAQGSGPVVAVATPPAHQAHQGMEGQANSANQAGAAAVTAPALDQDEARKLLRSLINAITMERLKLQEAERLGLSVPPSAIEEQVKLVEQRMGSRDTFDQELRRAHTTLDQWRTEYRQQLLLQQLEVRRRAALPVGNEEIQRYWERNGKVLSAAWHTDKPGPVQEQIRSLIQQEQWMATAKVQWERNLLKGARVSVNRRVYELLAVPSEPSEHAHH
jgi:hypothetical protein